jgi:electron transfer flavoprotein beta subunit
MGADEAFLISGREFAGSDTLATSTIIAAAIRKLGADVVFCGRQAIDGDTAQVGPQIAEHLGLHVISYAEAIEVKESSVVVKRQYDDRYHMVEAKMPCLITALAELNDPRYMTPGGIFDACAAEITTWGRADLKDVDDANLGLKGSPTKIAKASDKVRKGAGEKVNPDSPEEAVSYIVGKLTEKHVI